MRNVWIIALADLQMRFQSRRFWLLLVALPALVIYLVGLGAQGIARAVPASLRVDILDEDRSSAAAALRAGLAQANASLLLCPAADDRADACGLAGATLSPELARARLAGEVAFATLTIPAGFGAALDAGGPATLIFQPGAGMAAPAIIFAAVQNVATRLGGPALAARLSTQFAASAGIETGPEFLAARRAEAEASWGPPAPVRVSAEMARPNRGQIIGAQLTENGFKLSTPGIAAMFVMISILGLTHSLAEERMLGILGRLGTLPVSKAHLLAGKLLAACAAGALQFGILLALGEWLGVGFGGALLATLLLALAYVLAVSALALGLAALARDAGQAGALATLAWAVLVPLGGGWWPLAFVPDWMRVAGHLSPVAWCMDGLNALVFYGGTWGDVLLPAGVLLLFAGGFFAFATHRFAYRAPGDADAASSHPRMAHE